MPRRIVLGATAIIAWVVGGCATTNPDRLTAAPTLRRPSGGAGRERIGGRLPAPEPKASPAAGGLRAYFSRAAVSDAVMLRDQAEAGYREGTSP